MGDERRPEMTNDLQPPAPSQVLRVWWARPAPTEQTLRSERSIHQDERRKLVRPERQKGSPWEAWLYQGRLTEMAAYEWVPKGGPGFFQVRCGREKHIQAEETGRAQWSDQGTLSSMC